jgi:hypothetical protein
MSSRERGLGNPRRYMGDIVSKNVFYFKIYLNNIYFLFFKIIEFRTCLII